MAHRERPAAGTPEEQFAAVYAAHKIAFYNAGNRGIALRPTGAEEELLQRAYGNEPGEPMLYRREQSNRIAIACAVLADATMKLGFFSGRQDVPLLDVTDASGFVDAETLPAPEPPAAGEKETNKGGRPKKEKAADEPAA